MEIGSLTDWISSLSTFGTFTIAYMAYRKAPEWLSQKFDEEYVKASLKINDILIPNVIIACRNMLKIATVAPNIHMIYRYNYLEPKDYSLHVKNVEKIKNYINKNHSELLDSSIDTLKKSIDKINYLGWDLIKSKKSLINTVFEINNNSVAKLREIKNISKNSLSEKNDGLFNPKTDIDRIKKIDVDSEKISVLEDEYHVLMFEIIKHLEKYGEGDTNLSHFFNKK
ncbi:hypothetical protein [Serratia fonticola]|uniref:Uncharacterized protein n=1 Tax=Serratia fonticola TaxID=47917 RepID=A0ABY9PJC1_SERFO|nr:hypothetical protein [Serratia fonticola]WMT13512.1 hypothetical protein RFB13_20145 [Serratia fonticola]